MVLIHEKENQEIEKPENYRELVSSKNSSPTKKSTCSPFEEELGIKLCWNLELPDLSKGILDQRVLMLGPVHFMAALKKAEGLQSYKFSYQWENDKVRVGIIVFSEFDRRTL